MDGVTQGMNKRGHETGVPFQDSVNCRRDAERVLIYTEYFISVKRAMVNMALC